jgi:hypothetical protein
MDTIKLSRDIRGIINKYLDVSFKNIKKIIKINKDRNSLRFKDPNINLLDILIISARTGSEGFFIKKDILAKPIIEQVLNFKIPTNFKNKIIIRNSRNEIAIKFINAKDLCNIFSLNILEDY